MTTIIDPTNSPVIVYNRSGVMIVDVIGNGGNQGSATEIPHVSGTTVAKVTAVLGNTAVILPDNAEIGDTVEVYSLDESSRLPATVFPPSGERINQVVADASVDVYGGIFRKLSTTRWGVTGSIQ